MKKDEKKLKKETDHRSTLYRLLSSRACTGWEAAERLVQRGLDRSAAEDLVTEFQNLGLIDDRLYAQLFVEGHESWGRERIRGELRRLGIEPDVARSALEDLDEIERAQRLFSAWSDQGLPWEKITSRLMRRGFSGRVIRSLKPNACDW